MPLHLAIPLPNGAFIYPTRALLDEHKGVGGFGDPAGALALGRDRVVDPSLAAGEEHGPVPVDGGELGPVLTIAGRTPGASADRASIAERSQEILIGAGKQFQAKGLIERLGAWFSAAKADVQTSANRTTAQMVPIRDLVFILLSICLVL